MDKKSTREAGLGGVPSYGRTYPREALGVFAREWLRDKLGSRNGLGVVSVYCIDASTIGDGCRGLLVDYQQPRSSKIVSTLGSSAPNHPALDGVVAAQLAVYRASVLGGDTAEPRRTIYRIGPTSDRLGQWEIPFPAVKHIHAVIKLPS